MNRRFGHEIEALAGLINEIPRFVVIIIIITDMHMPDMDAFSFVKTAKRMVPNIPIIVASGLIEPQEAADFKSLGVASILEKPFSQEKLVKALFEILTV